MEVVIALVVVAVTVLAVSALCGRWRVAAPIPLILVGLAASYVPQIPEIHLETEIVLVGLLPPLLYAAALSTSLVDFNANRRPILLLSFGLVVFTTVGVGVFVQWLIPGLGWPAAFAIGAVVAPPDAVAATAIGRRVGLPRRIVTILEGESLFNDATALVSLRTAIAAMGAGITAWQIGLDFVVAAVGGLAIGMLFYVSVAQLRRRIHDPLIDTGVSLVVPFAAYVAAEEVEASGVIAVVVAGLLLGHRAPVLQTATSRIAERTNWRTIAFLLENAVFLLIGLQAHWIVAGVLDSTLPMVTVVAACLGSLAAVVVLRFVWVFASRALLIRPDPDPHTGEVPFWRHSVLLSWAGMRGVVTLAAAFVIPASVPHREVLLMIAFTVVAGTLLGQGLTLGWLARRLRIPVPNPLDDALARAALLQQASVAGRARLQAMEFDDPHDVRGLMRQRIEQRDFAAWERLGTTPGQDSPSALYSRVRAEMLEAERERVLEIRSTGEVPSEVVADVLAMLDVEESMLDAAEEQRAEVTAGMTRGRLHTSCRHLDTAPARDPDADLVCATCLAEGNRWVALRMCLECGEVGCCDSSPRRHATRHFHETGHPVMRSVEPDEIWRWCFVDHLTG